VHRIRSYVDTSVFGGVLDEEFATASSGFFKRVARGDFLVMLSVVTIQELLRAPEPVRMIWKNILPEMILEIPISAEVESLAQAYIDSLVLTAKHEVDALHVAAATVAGADLILSWNFRHIVNFDRILGFNAVNTRLGYRSMTILSPLEVAYDDEDD